MVFLPLLFGCQRGATPPKVETPGQASTVQPPPGKASQPSAEAVQHYQAGLKFKQAKDYDNAVTELTKAVELAPDYADAHYALAWVWAAKQDKENAAAEFSEVLRLSPTSDKGQEAKAAMERLESSETPIPVTSPAGTPDSPPEPAAAPLPKGEGSLASLIKQGQVEATATAIGGSSGDTIRLTLRRKVDTVVQADLLPGTVLRSDDPAVQDMVAYQVRGTAVDEERFQPTDAIVLESDEPVTYIVAAYCLDFDKDNPSAGGTFALADPSPAMARLLARARKQDADTPTIQATVWMAQGVPAGEIRQRFPVDQAQLSAARRLIRRGE
jgi:tetratricopeptide (TPR) repeat protein